MAEEPKLTYYQRHYNPNPDPNWRHRPRTAKWKQRLSESTKGITRKKYRPEWCKKISESLKGNIPWNKGRTMSKEYNLNRREHKIKQSNDPLLWLKEYTKDE